MVQNIFADKFFFSLFLAVLGSGMLLFFFLCIIIGHAS